jgi:hypothetical protein
MKREALDLVLSIGTRVLQHVREHAPELLPALLEQARPAPRLPEAL